MTIRGNPYFRWCKSFTTIWGTPHFRWCKSVMTIWAHHISDGLRRFRQYEAPHISDGLRRFGQYEAPHISEASTRLCGYMSSSLKWYHCRWERWRNVITNTWPNWTKRPPNCLVWLYKKCSCSHPIFCRCSTIWKIKLPDTGTVYLPDPLRKHNTLRKMLSYS
jgi:hypothetical protein